MTKEYVGVKCITAWPEEKDGKPGYAVRYPGGYQSWSPKEVFEEAYLCLGETAEVNDEALRPLIAKYGLAHFGDTISWQAVLEFVVDWGKNGLPNPDASDLEQAQDSMDESRSE